MSKGLGTAVAITASTGTATANTIVGHLRDSGAIAGGLIETVGNAHVGVVTVHDSLLTIDFEVTEVAGEAALGHPWACRDGAGHGLLEASSIAATIGVHLLNHGRSIGDLNIACKGNRLRRERALILRLRCSSRWHSDHSLCTSILLGNDGSHSTSVGVDSGIIVKGIANLSCLRLKTIDGCVSLIHLISLEGLDVAHNASSRISRGTSIGGGNILIKNTIAIHPLNTIAILSNTEAVAAGASVAYEHHLVCRETCNSILTSVTEVPMPYTPRAYVLGLHRQQSYP